MVRAIQHHSSIPPAPPGPRSPAVPVAPKPAPATQLSPRLLAEAQFFASDQRGPQRAALAQLIAQRPDDAARLLQELGARAKAGGAWSTAWTHALHATRAIIVDLEPGKQAVPTAFLHAVAALDGTKPGGSRVKADLLHLLTAKSTQLSAHGPAGIARAELNRGAKEILVSDPVGAIRELFGRGAAKSSSVPRLFAQLMSRADTAGAVEVVVRENARATAQASADPWALLERAKTLGQTLAAVETGSRLLGDREDQAISRGATILGLGLSAAPAGGELSSLLGSIEGGRNESRVEARVEHARKVAKAAIEGVLDPSGARAKKKDPLLLGTLTAIHGAVVAVLPARPKLGKLSELELESNIGDTILSHRMSLGPLVEPALGGGRRPPNAEAPFEPPPIRRDARGRLTNGTYTIDEPGMVPHKSGQTAAPAKSQFLARVDAESATLDAAAYADAKKLWKNNRAKVYVENGPVGVVGKTGLLTQWVNVYRTQTGMVHAAPGSPPKP